MEEAIIFAGTGAWKAAQDYQKGKGEHGDDVPPVVLDHTQLAELPHLRIVDKGRRFARVCQAGLIEQNQISMIANKLCEAGVTNAEFINEKGEKEDWTPLMKRLEDEPLMVTTRGSATPALNQMGASQRGKFCLLITMAIWRSMLIPTRFIITTAWCGFRFRIKSCSEKWRRFLLMPKSPIRRTRLNPLSIQ
jgi:hypothetical protein